MVGRVTVALAVALTAAVASADGAAALTRAQATRIALKALQPQKAKGASVVVFASQKPLPAGTFVYEARPKKIIGTRGKNATPVGARTSAPAWLFWEDLSYGAMFAHPSVMLLVDDRTGRVVKRQRMLYELMIGRVRAPWLRDQTAYGRTTHVVYPAAKRRAAASPPSARAAAYPLNGKPPPRPATLARECLVTIGDPTDWKKSLDAMETFGKNVGLKMPATRPKDFAGLRDAVEALIDQGCGDVFVYVVGHGVIPRGRDFPKGEKRELVMGKTDADIQPATGEGAGPAAIKVRSSAKLDDITSERPEYRDESGYITPDNLVALAKENRLTADFKFKIDTCFAGRFERVFDEADNVRVLELSSRFNEISYAKGTLFGNQPVVDPGTKKRTGERFDIDAISNPDDASSFTNGNLHGLYQWFATAPPNEPFVEGIAKSFDLGKDEDFARRGGWTRPKLRTRGPATRPVDFLQLDGRISIDPGDPNEFFVDGTFTAADQRALGLRQASSSPIDLLIFSTAGGRQVTDSICPPELPVGQRNGTSLSCSGGALGLGKPFRMKLRTSPRPSAGMGGQLFARQNGKVKGPFAVP